MKQKIAILGSTGSIGKSLLKIIKKDKKKFEISLLTANKNYKILLKQVKEFNVKNIIITDQKYYKIAKLKYKNSKINIYNNFESLDLILKKKIDYTMSSIVGLNGLYPTLKIIKYTKIIAIANKESLICAWNLIKRELNLYNTKFIPVDSEHFSIWFALKNIDKKKIEKIYLTASGGPLLNLPYRKFKNLKISQITKHPNWPMGKKISVDSSTLMNKVFEVIEAKKIFNIQYDKISILIHPKSYIHAILKFTNGMIKIVAHDTTMKIPIFNTIYNNEDKKIKSKNLNLSIINNPNLANINLNRFPLVRILDKLPKHNSLYETAIVSANDALVEMYLKKEIQYKEITKKLLSLANTKEIISLKKIIPKNISQIEKLNKYVRLKIKTNSI
jgi:1-deoxy-D-xylulose-5-phosphate reductoisomerase